MQTKVLAFRKEARDKLFEGVSLLADAVTTTLGPKGRNVAIQRTWGMPIVVHDGVTVAREVDSTDPLVAIGINLVREAASKTNEEAGDGTTTATLLAYEIVKRGLKLVDSGVNPMVLRTQIYAVLPKLIAELKSFAKPVESNADIARVAYISSADEEIGKLVAEAIDKVGKDGLVTVDESKTMETEVDITEGMEFNKGFLAPHFITNPQRMEAIIENPIIALIDKKLSLNTEIVPILEKMAKTSKDIVIIAESISGDALATMAANKLKGNINAVAVEAPGIADNKTNYLEDIAVLTGGRVLSDKNMTDVEANDTWIGRAERVISSRDTTVIINGKGDKKEVKARIEDMRAQEKNDKSTFEKEKIKERLARLSTGIAVIRVGAKTEIDMRERVERVKDAVGAATAAKDEGIVAGGGVAFLRMCKVLGSATDGERLMAEVLVEPIYKLLVNSGEENPEATLEEIKLYQTEKPNVGYEVNSGEAMDMIDRGIIDPAKVLRLALENAVAVSTSILTTDAIIGIKESKDDKPEV